MPYQAIVGRPQRKFRLLISGFPNTGKTTSLQTFVENGKTMAIVVCPGEMGIRSLPDVDYIDCYTPEMDFSSDVTWSQAAVTDFCNLLIDLEKHKLDILALDGLHSLYEQQMNIITGGKFLAGASLGTAYEPARYYSQAYNSFGQLLAKIYHSPIPMVIGTTWQDYEASAGNEETEDKPGSAAKIESKRYLWPAIPGKMAKAIVGRFDACISAQLGKICLAELHRGCRDKANATEHYLWQCLSRGDVRGVGIKGLKPSPAMVNCPFIHQNWQHLKRLLTQHS